MNLSARAQAQPNVHSTMSPHPETGAHNAQHDVADLTGSESIQPPHLAEALDYRPKVMHSTMCWGIVLQKSFFHVNQELIHTRTPWQSPPGRCAFGAGRFR